MAELRRLLPVGHDQAQRAQTAAHPELNLAQFGDDAAVVVHFTVPLKGGIACLVGVPLSADRQVAYHTLLAGCGSEGTDADPLMLFLLQFYFRFGIGSFRQGYALQIYPYLTVHLLVTQRRLVRRLVLLDFCAWFFLLWFFKRNRFRR